MSLLRAAPITKNTRKMNRVGAMTVSTESGSDVAVATIRKFVGDPLDRYLAQRGLVKKLIANDNGSSVYRAVCEALTGDQGEAAALQQFVQEELLFQYRMDRLRNGLPYVDKIDDTLRMIAELLGIELHIYGGFANDPVMLCESHRGHFDLVLTMEDHTNFGYAQTILYELLYIDVFKFSKETIKESIRKVREDMDAVGIDVDTPSPGEQPYAQFSFSNDDMQKLSATIWRPPIPYSSVKSLDPSVYRNLAFDLYWRSRRSPDAFKRGSFCLYREEECFYQACVASAPDNSSRIIFVNGVYRRVSVSDLFPFPEFVRRPDPSSRTSPAPSEQVPVAPQALDLTSYPGLPFRFEYFAESFSFMYGYHGVWNSTNAATMPAGHPVQYVNSYPWPSGTTYIPADAVPSTSWSSSCMMYLYEYGNVCVFPYNPVPYVESQDVRNSGWSTGQEAVQDTNSTRQT
ncbi:hypothetical protein Q1695_014230 [Nippostrongylus brasiliensis]|nr:hypothetical protein Q1695_014230 [Nippostrongylus brasiliensis]